VLDFQRREVYEWQGEEWEYRLRVAPELVEAEIVDHVEDWINDLFLSCRFEAERKGAYNEYVYNFFKCLSLQRLEYAEGYYAEKAHEHQFFEAEGYRIQRRCPHLRADLTRFGHIEDGVLTCALHGWQFELATGRCLTSDDRKLFAQPISEAAQAEVAAAAEATQATQVEQPAQASGGATLPASADLRAFRDDSRLIRDRCGHCWYDPKRKL